LFLRNNVKVDTLFIFVTCQDFEGKDKMTIEKAAKEFGLTRQSLNILAGLGVIQQF